MPSSACKKKASSIRAMFERVCDATCPRLSPVVNAAAPCFRASASAIRTMSRGAGPKAWGGGVDDGGESRTGSVADPLEHRADRRGRRDADSEAPDRHGQAGDHRGGAPARDVRDLGRAGCRLLHAVRPETPGDADVGA